MKYRKKPVVVEAFRLTDDPDMEAPDWFTRAVIDGRVWIDRIMKDGHIYVHGCTIGRHKAKIGDYIIRGVVGELYPCKPDIFLKTYEEA